MPKRARELALPCAWIALDVDTLTPAAATALTAALVEWRGFGHASLSATPDNLKRRVVLECERVVELTEHKPVVAAVEAWLRERVGEGIEFDGAASGDVARVWYLPAQGAAAGVFVGEPIDVDRALADSKAHAEPEREHVQGDGPHVGEGGRNAMMTREGGKLRRIGLSTATIAAALHQINRRRCDPPLEDDEVETIARSIGKYAAEPDADNAKPEPGELLGTIYSGAALLETMATPTRWLVDGWVSEGASVLIGAHGGTGKSWLALQAAACLAAGQPFLGLATQCRRTLLYAAEDRADVLRWRLRSICAGLSIAPATLDENLIVIDQSRKPAELMGRDRYGALGFAPLFEVLADELGERQTDVLVIDSASDAFGGNEIARAEVRRYICEVQRLVPDAGAVLHVVHVDKAHRPRTRQRAGLLGPLLLGTTASANDGNSRAQPTRTRTAEGGKPTPPTRAACWSWRRTITDRPARSSRCASTRRPGLVADYARPLADSWTASSGAPPSATSCASCSRPKRPASQCTPPSAPTRTRTGGCKSRGSCRRDSRAARGARRYSTCCCVGAARG